MSQQNQSQPDKPTHPRDLIPPPCTTQSRMICMIQLDQMLQRSCTFLRRAFDIVRLRRWQCDPCAVVGVCVVDGIGCFVRVRAGGPPRENSGQGEGNRDHGFSVGRLYCSLYSTTHGCSLKLWPDVVGILLPQEYNTRKQCKQYYS